MNWDFKIKHNMKPLTRKDIKELVDSGTFILLHKVKDRDLIISVEKMMAEIRDKHKNKK